MQSPQAFIPHLLLVDDDEDEFRILSEALKDADIACQVTWAIGPQHGLAILKYFTPQFIFMDFRMPTMNGIECIQLIHKMPQASEIPVVLYSSEIDRTLQEKALAAGAVACLKKTGHLAQLSSGLRELFSQAPLATQLQRLYQQ